MTEQFSKEYVAFLEHEGGMLQRLWQRKYGDWFLLGNDTETFRVHTKPFVPSGKPITWVPTLWQLIQIIEGAGWHVGWKPLPQKGEWTRYMVWATRHEESPDHEYIDEIESDLILAAACLAVKALQRQTNE